MEINYQQDLNELKKLTQAFETIYTNDLGLKVFEEAKPMDYIKHGAIKIYTTQKPNVNESKYIRHIQGGLIWLSSDINPNGITGLHDIGRTYTIKFEAKCEERIKYGRYWYASSVVQHYCYGRTVEEALNKFSEYFNKLRFNNFY
jgi:hypothetical protein